MSPSLGQHLEQASCSSDGTYSNHQSQLQGVFHGDMNGQVFVFPAISSEQLCSPNIFCDIQEPVLAVLAVPYHSESDMLMVVGQFGRVVAVAPTIAESADSPFVASHSGSKFAKVFQVDLKGGFHICDWQVQGPVRSACVAGFGRLCHCSGSEVFIVDLFEGGDAAQLRNTYDVSQSLCIKSVLGHQIKKFPESHRVPVAEPVISAVCKGDLTRLTGCRSLVVLTTRGRLLGLEVSGHILATECLNYNNVIGEYWKTWKAGLERMEEHVKELIHTVEKIEQCSEVIWNGVNSVNIAISELASALILAYEVSRDQSRAVLQIPEMFSDNRPLSGLWCTLDIIPPAMAVPREHLCFCSNGQPSKTFQGLWQTTIGVQIQVCVTLFNHTVHPISSYWSVMVELRGCNSTDNCPILCLSSAINGGYGLQSHTHCTIEFSGDLPVGIESPLIASVFLCHIHDHHNFITERSPTFDLHGADGLEKFEIKDKDSCIEACFSVKPTPENIPGAVCLLLTRYRFDVLSFLRPQLEREQQCHAFQSSAESIQNDDIPLGPFSGSFHLDTIRKNNYFIANKTDVRQKWQEIGLEDLVDKMILSKAGNQVMAYVRTGGNILVSLEDRIVSTEGYCCKDLLFSAPSLLVSCFVREALMWRMFIKQEQLNTHFLGKDAGIRFITQNQQKVKFVMEMMQKLEIIIDHTDASTDIGKTIIVQDHSETPDASTFFLEETQSVMTDLLKVYRSYRENSVSDPVSSL